MNKRTFGIRLLEILPGFLTWVTLIGAPLLSYYHPVWISVYIILFDLYWFLKGGNVATHLMHSYYRLKVHDKIDWKDWCQRLIDTDGFKKYLNQQVLEANKRITKRNLKEKFSKEFHSFSIVVNPDGLLGEARGKGANCAFAAEKIAQDLINWGIPYENVIVSNFDCDTSVATNYFAHLTFDFLTIDKPHQASYQPMPMFHNNIWDTPAIARVIAISSSFWQLVEASRPDRLVTFSSHSMSFKTLVEVGFWRRDLIPEDSYIFWQCFNYFNGDYRTHPLFTVVSMDAVLG